MNKRIKSDWIEALRSGDYEQGMEFLNRDGTFCCLGVLCDIYRKQEGGDIWADNPYDMVKGIKSFRGESSILPVIVSDWAGLQDDPRVKGVHLTEHNDGVRGPQKTFNEIADMIDKEL